MHVHEGVGAVLKLLCYTDKKQVSISHYMMVYITMWNVASPELPPVTIAWDRRWPGPVYTKRTNVLPPTLANSRGSEIGSYNGRISLKFNRHLGSTAAEVPVKFQSDQKSLNPNIVASRRLHGNTYVRLVNRGPWTLCGVYFSERVFMNLPWCDCISF